MSILLTTTLMENDSFSDMLNVFLYPRESRTHFEKYEQVFAGAPLNYKVRHF